MSSAQGCFKEPSPRETMQNEQRRGWDRALGGSGKQEKNQEGYCRGHTGSSQQCPWSDTLSDIEVPGFLEKLSWECCGGRD